MHDVPIVTGTTAVQIQSTRETVILVVNQALCFGDSMSNSLLNLNQLQHFGTTVQDNPFDKRGLFIMTEDDTMIPMMTRGTTISFESRTPTQSELETCRHITLTSDLEWDTCHVKFPDSNCKEEKDHQTFDISTITSIANISVLEDEPNHPIFLSADQKTDTSPSALSKHWQIGMNQVAQTLRVTTQCG